MKIKYKLILMFILIILFASMPVSLFILHKQEQEKIITATNQGSIFSTILAQSVLNIILANGGDIKTTQVDTKEMMAVLKTLTDEGLIYAETILISSKKEYNGIVLAHFHADSVHPGMWRRSDRIGNEEMNKLARQKNFRELYLPGISDVCYEFTGVGGAAGTPPA